VAADRGRGGVVRAEAPEAGGASGTGIIARATKNSSRRFERER